LPAEAEPIQNSLTVAVERNSCADVTELIRLFIDPNINPNCVECHGCGQSTDTATNDRYS
jgi:hypothetical protein